MKQHQKNNCIWFTSALFDSAHGSFSLRHGFSTKYGGISTDPFLRDLNFGFGLGEERSVTLENYRLFAGTLGIDAGHLLCARQTHTNLVLTVREKDRRLGFDDEVPHPTGIYENGYDALVTASPGVALSVRTADCVPILFWDPKNSVIGAAHAGWRGTLGSIAAETVSSMEKLGAERHEILACIGSAIGVCCYEVDNAFHDRFLAVFGNEICREVFLKSPEYEHPEQYHCDLPALNRKILLNAGLSPARIEVSDLCTCCTPDLFHSHRYAMRKTGGKRGLMAAMISME